MDSVKAVVYSNKQYIIARSYANSSKCYWTSLDNNGKWSSWNLLGGGSVTLMTDVSIVYNSFSKVRHSSLVCYSSLNPDYYFTGRWTSFLNILSLAARDIFKIQTVEATRGSFFASTVIEMQTHKS